MGSFLAKIRFFTTQRNAHPHSLPPLLSSPSLPFSSLPQLPTSKFGYNIHHTLGFRFPLYNHIVLTFDLPSMKALRVIESHKPDIIHVTSPGFFLFAAIIYSRVMRVPLVMAYHTHLPVYGKNYLGWVPGIEAFAWWLIRLGHNRADLTLVTSSQMKEELEANGVPRVDVWRKGIDVEKFNPKFKSASMRERMTDGNPDDFLLIYVGRLGFEKRLKDVKSILSHLPSNVRMVFVGKGPHDDQLKAYMSGTQSVFMGQMTGSELSSAFASADLFVMPSDSETLGFVVLESMASGVPVVAARAGGIPDLIEDGEDGFLVEAGNARAFAGRIRELMEDEGRRGRMAVKGREEAEKWGWEAATSLLRNVQYTKAIRNFERRAFGGYGDMQTSLLQRLFRYRWHRLKRRVRGVWWGGERGASGDSFTRWGVRARVRRMVGYGTTTS